MKSINEINFSKHSFYKGSIPDAVWVFSLAFILFITSVSAGFSLESSSSVIDKKNLHKTFFAINMFPICADPSPIISCASVQTNGDVLLDWNTPTSGSSFDSYHIFSSTSATGPYTVVDSIFSINQTTYTHAGANANLGPVYYYIQTRCGAMDYSPALDTIQTMKLTVLNPANGTASLTWNPIGSDTAATYSIYEEFPVGVWSLTGSKLNPQGFNATIRYIDTIIICNGSINYKIELTDDFGCVSSSSIAGETFQNLIVPATPRFDTMSVDDNNNSIMSWNVSQSADVEGYVVYKYNGTTFIPLDSIVGRTSTSYMDASSDAASNSEQYRLAAYDNCGNISQLGSPANTINLTSTPDVCNRGVILSWTDYSTFTKGLGGYRIFQSEVGPAGPYTLVASIAIELLSYPVSGLTAQSTYYYKVEAVDKIASKTVSSNRISFYSDTPVPPQFLYLQNVSVLDPNQVELTCHIDVSSAESEFKIMRGTDATVGGFVQVGTVFSNGISPITFLDPKVNIDKYVYNYKVVSVDSCGLENLVSDTSSTILLNVKSNKVLSINTLTWNDYTYWNGGVTSYNVYRGIDGKWEDSPITSIPYFGFGTNEYVDDISQILDGQGVFSYYVEAVEGGGNQFGFSETSLSNIAEAYQPSKIFIPNAFYPEGIHNKIFKPVTTYVNFSGYEFLVFNRMGLKVFETHDITEGWDGTYKGKVSEFGVYVYKIRYKSSTGKYFDLKGSVTLMR